MKKSRFSETQIVSILKEAEAGLKVDDVCRNSTGTYYNWKSKDVGLSVSERGFPELSMMEQAGEGLAVAGKLRANR